MRITDWQLAAASAEGGIKIRHVPAAPTEGRMREYIEGPDSALPVSASIGALYHARDTNRTYMYVEGTYSSGPLAERPGHAEEGTVYYAEDEGVMYVWIGA